MQHVLIFDIRIENRKLLKTMKKYDVKTEINKNKVKREQEH